MFRYVIALFLINTSYSSLGSPAKKDTGHTAISNVFDVLVNLETKCGNPILSKEIKSRATECLNAGPQETIQKIKCFMFYDINYQLCTAVGTSKLVLKDDYSTEINKEQDVNSLCDEAKDWVFSNISAHSHYKLENIFKNPVVCGRVCGTDDLNDSDYYCKYFKWGLKMLKSQNNSSTSTIPQVNLGVEVDTKQNVSDTQENNADTKNVPLSDSLDLKVNSDTSSTKLKVNNTLDKPTSENKIEAPIISQSISPASSTSTDKQVNSSASQKDLEINPDINKQKESPISGGVNQNEDLSNVLESDKNAMVPVLQQPNLEDSDTGIDTVDTYDDTGDDNDEGRPINNQESKPKIPVDTAVETANKLPVESKSGDYYGGSNQEGYTDNDDHFFTFFLITVIAVIVLYVLYHNKNKVSKVFFGLILEGRQAGRRRNSRGHSYRRLDTLEQAMSGPAAAPPTKIIY